MSEPVLRPAALRPGDVVGVIAPAGPVLPDRLEAGLQVLRDWGLQPKVYPHVLSRAGYLAGTDAQRVGDLNAALNDPQVRAVLCARGGYGVQRILEQVDYAAMRRDPKLLMGFSDITALHAAVWCNTGVCSVHGPVVGQLGQGGELGVAARHALMSREPVLVHADPSEPTFVVRRRGGGSGRVEGRLLGGNLTMLASCVGTPYQLGLKGAILLLEDIGEAPYRIDRTLTQLRNAGVLEGVVGVALGQFTGVRDEKYASSLEQVLLDRLGDLGIPLLGGLSIGHGEHNIAVPLGTDAVLEAEAGTLWVAAATC